MKKIALVLSLALVACLALAGCQSETGGAGDPVPGGVTEPSVSLNENKNEIEKLLCAGVKITEQTEVKSGSFSGEKVVLTGSLTSYTRSEAGKLVEERGGEIQSSVTKTTTLVIAGEAAGSKLDKAKKLGITVIGEEEFKGRL